jgi:hypothetical protein
MTDPVFVEKAREVCDSLNITYVDGPEILATALQEATETARNDALEEAAVKTISFGRSGGRTRVSHKAVAEAIRHLKSKAGEQ